MNMPNGPSSTPPTPPITPGSPPNTPTNAPIKSKTDRITSCLDKIKDFQNAVDKKGNTVFIGMVVSLPLVIMGTFIPILGFSAHLLPLGINIIVGLVSTSIGIPILLWIRKPALDLVYKRHLATKELNKSFPTAFPNRVIDFKQAKAQLLLSLPLAKEKES